MQDDPRDVLKLIDDLGEELPAHVAGRFQRLESARAGRAQKIAAVRGLQIEADRFGLGHRSARVGDVREVAARVNISGARARHL